MSTTLTMEFSSTSKMCHCWSATSYVGEGSHIPALVFLAEKREVENMTDGKGQTQTSIPGHLSSQVSLHTRHFTLASSQSDKTKKRQSPFLSLSLCLATCMHTCICEYKGQKTHLSLVQCPMRLTYCIECRDTVAFTPCALHLTIILSRDVRRKYALFLHI